MPSNQAGSVSIETSICRHPPVSACPNGFAADIRPIPRTAAKMRGALNYLFAAGDLRKTG